MLEQRGRKDAEAELRTLRERERADAASRELALREAAERDQAEHVHFWMDFSGEPERSYFHMANTSDMPVMSVAVLAKVPVSTDDSALATNTAITFWSVGTVPPRGSVDKAIATEPGRQPPYFEPEGWRHWIDEARFTDANGRRWSRKFDNRGTSTLELSTDNSW